MRVVMKFGGAAVADGTMMRRVAELIKRFRVEDGMDIVAVTSAIAGVTDALQDNAIRIAQECRKELVKDFLEKLREKHLSTARDAIFINGRGRSGVAATAEERTYSEIVRETEERLRELENALLGICLLGELTKRSLDFILSFGERLSAPILAGTLRTIGIKATHLTGGEAGIITDENFGNAQPLEISEHLIRERVLHILNEGITPVICGFIAQSERGIITTLGRGGSDYTATIVGAAIDADEIWLWKDTEGIMSADPKIIKNAKKIPYLSYIEAMELSYFGATVLHPRAMEPVMRGKIPIRVKNLNDPDDEGTLIGEESERTDKIAKAITLIENASILNISGTGMMKISEVAAQIFKALSSEGIDVVMISQGSSERTISIVIERSNLNAAMRAMREMRKKDVVQDIICDSDVCAVGVVGAGMVGTPGVAGKIFSALGNAGISVRMISQGSSEFNISFVVSRKDAYKAVRTIHDILGMGK